MLRNFLLAVSLVVALVGVVLLNSDRHAWPIVIWGVVLLVLTLAERWRYQRSQTMDGEDWRATDEQFIDPETGKLTRVYYSAATGERRYIVVDDDGSLH